MTILRTIEKYPNDKLLARAAATAWLDQVYAANRAGALHCVALSGGRIAKSLFSAASQQACARKILFSNVHFFWADERCVPPDDAESNFRMAHEYLFSPLKVQDDHVHRICGEQPPDVAAAEAEVEIRRLVPLNRVDQPVLDLIFLGMGEDGHVASLFPGEPASGTVLMPAYFEMMSDIPTTIE